MKKVTLIIPCFNEEESIPLLYKELSRVFSTVRDSYSFTMLFVDDGSTDQTLEIIKAVAARNSSVKYISFSRNFGKEAAMLAGMEYADGDYIGIIDADLQHSPDLIPGMLDALTIEGYDVAAARRTDRAGEGRVKSSLSGEFYKVFNRISDIKIDDNAQDYRIMKRKVVDALLEMKEVNRFSKGLFAYAGFKVKWFPHENQERAAGQTKWSLKGLARYAIDGILGLTTSPLRLSLYTGCVSVIAGLILALYGLIASIVSASVLSHMYALLLSALLFVGGLIMVFIGIAGEYLGRAFVEIKHRPVYIISETNAGKSVADLDF